MVAGGGALDDPAAETAASTLEGALKRPPVTTGASRGTETDSHLRFQWQPGDPKIGGDIVDMALCSASAAADCSGQRPRLGPLRSGAR
jgi:hypothetical protein